MTDLSQEPQVSTQRKPYSTMTGDTFQHIIEGLGCGDDLYLYDTPLSEMILAIRSALFLGKHAELQAFISETRKAVKKLKKL